MITSDQGRALGGQSAGICLTGRSGNQNRGSFAQRIFRGCEQRRTHGTRRCIAVVAFLRHAFAEHRGHRRTHLRSHTIGKRQRIGQTIYNRRGATERVRRFHVGNQMKERRCQRIDITARISSQPLNLFQWRVVWGVAEDAGRSCHHRHLARRTFGQSKIEQHNLPARSQLEILRLDVAVNDLRILGMQIVERVAKLIGPAQHLCLRERTVPLRQHAEEILAGNVLHYQELSLSFGKVIADSRQRGMVHSRQQTRFALELLAQSFVGEKRFLQRHRGIEPLIKRFIHCPHSALAKLANNAVAPLQNCVRC